jgi:hypothetical protein
MLDFTPVRSRHMTMMALSQDVTVADLHVLTDEMVDALCARLADAADADVTFVPVDREAYDQVAATREEVSLPWTLGHVIVHTTASAEEAAFSACELARGVPFHGRSRCEVHWTTVHTVAQCRHRLDESRRMRHALLKAWPDPPHLDVFYPPSAHDPAPRNAIARFLGGLSHDDSHLGQFDDILRQARAARSAGG